MPSVKCTSPFATLTAIRLTCDAVQLFFWDGPGRKGEDATSPHRAARPHTHDGGHRVVVRCPWCDACASADDARRHRSDAAPNGMLPGRTGRVRCVCRDLHRRRVLYLRRPAQRAAAWLLRWNGALRHSPQRDVHTRSVRRSVVGVRRRKRKRRRRKWKVAWRGAVRAPCACESAQPRHRRVPTCVEEDARVGKARQRGEAAVQLRPKPTRAPRQGAHGRPAPKLDVRVGTRRAQREAARQRAKLRDHVPQDRVPYLVWESDAGTSDARRDLGYTRVARLHRPTPARALVPMAKKSTRGANGRQWGRSSLCCGASPSGCS